MRCRVSVVLDNRHARQGRQYAIRIDLTIPHHELVSNREHDEDVYIALRDAFKDITRMLEDTVRQERGQVKAHDVCLQGVVVQLNRDERYGFIRGADENDYYFSPENLTDLAFDQVEIGTAVHFIAGIANEGRQAQRISGAAAVHASSK